VGLVRLEGVESEKFGSLTSRTGVKAGISMEYTPGISSRI
jgi:hypothetical protein